MGVRRWKIEVRRWKLDAGNWKNEIKRKSELKLFMMHQNKVS